MRSRVLLSSNSLLTLTPMILQLSTLVNLQLISPKPLYHPKIINNLHLSPFISNLYPSNILSLKAKKSRSQVEPRSIQQWNQAQGCILNHHRHMLLNNNMGNHLCPSHIMQMGPNPSNNHSIRVNSLCITTHTINNE
jgi:hypothetical protein